MLTKVELIALLQGMPDNTEIVVPSYRNPATQITQISRTESALNPAGDPCLVLVPASILPFRPEPSNDTTN
jgi:hypothetical protein